MRTESHYSLLGVAQDASPEQIRAAYHEQVRRYHPDRHQDNPLSGLAEERLRKLNAAYETLSDQTRRAAYDAELGQARRRSSKLWTLWLLALLALPLLLRFGIAVVRVLARGLVAVLSALRGTPWLLGLFVMAVGLLLWKMARSRKRGS